MRNASRIELHPNSQRVQVHVDGKLLANITQTLEHRYSQRQYLTRETLQNGLLITSEMTTHHPLKGDMEYV